MRNISFDTKIVSECQNMRNVHVKYITIIIYKFFMSYNFT